MVVHVQRKERLGERERKALSSLWEKGQDDDACMLLNTANFYLQV